jgi:hypothetical protein
MSWVVAVRKEPSSNIDYKKNSKFKNKFDYLVAVVFAIIVRINTTAVVIFQAKGGLNTSTNIADEGIKLKEK